MNKSNYITLHAVNVAFINYYKVSMKFAFFFQKTDKLEPCLQRYKKTNGFLRNVPCLRYGNVSVLHFFKKKTKSHSFYLNLKQSR